MKKLMVLLLALMISPVFMNVSNAQDKKVKPWVVPETAKKIKNPVKSDAESLKLGKSLFTKHCKSCHGSAGLGDGPKSKELDTPCGDFTLAKFQAQTDGEIFYKTKEGRDDMPSFKKKISDDEEIWMIVNYLRTLAEK